MDTTFQGVEAPFLTARWINLCMANYEVDSNVLRELVPTGTEIDLWAGKCFVSVVGFQFLDTRVRGIAIPFRPPSTASRFSPTLSQQKLLLLNTIGAILRRETDPLSSTKSSILVGRCGRVLLRNWTAMSKAFTVSGLLLSWSVHRAHVLSQKAPRS
jgi:hypothetical protein